MNSRQSLPVPPRPRTTSPTNLAFRPSTSDWYASWKARKSVSPAPVVEQPETNTKADADEALVRWLKGGEK